MYLRKCFIASALSILIIASTGCVAPMAYKTVVPELPQATQGEINHNIIEINLPELTLSTQVQAIEWNGRSIPPPLGIWMNIKPLKGPLSFQTSQVKLKVDGNDEIPSISYYGPKTKWFSPRAFAAGCGPRFYRTGIGLTRNSLTNAYKSIMETNKNVGIYRPSDDPIKVESDSCFLFWFDTDALPVHTFILNVHEVRLGNSEISIPEIHFKPGEITEWRGFP